MLYVKCGPAPGAGATAATGTQFLYGTESGHQRLSSAMDGITATARIRAGLSGSGDAEAVPLRVGEKLALEVKL